MIKKYYDTDCNLGFLDGKTVAIMGYGSQGHAHAQNLHESGVDVVVGLRKDSASWAKAEAAGLKVMEVPEAAKAADVVMMLVPDEIAADIYNEQVAPYMKEGDVLMFAHGFNIHFQFVKPAKNIDVIMVAPKGPGHTVRSQYVNGKGVPCLVAVEQNATGNAMITPAMPRISRWLTPAALAQAAPAFWKPPSVKRPRPTCSASSACCAAA